MILGWRAPGVGDPDWNLLDSLGHLLGGGEGSRLTQSLVKGAGVASSATANVENSPGQNFFTIVVTAVPGKDQAQIEDMCDREIARIAKEGVPDTELDRLRMSEIKNHALMLVSTMVRSVMLARLKASVGYAEALNRWEDGERKLTSDALGHVAQRYLNPANRVTLTVLPKESQ
jgi:zinc protease